ncbi:hypothetical protein Patl1_30269 [Pistacia atlantica]|uniref:Uncharacterized protein n=1 Tax=Pistacia atlantica TaxID=434234 RepID=A0ACC1ABV2_9ROSI|nr:hypothetical protein Patl1_30269 [Pistacia atlantica]
MESSFHYSHPVGVYDKKAGAGLLYIILMKVIGEANFQRNRDLEKFLVDSGLYESEEDAKKKEVIWPLISLIAFVDCNSFVYFVGLVGGSADGKGREGSIPQS